ncbi:hypothetical protein MJT46_007644 [Ovis ammon polii x Ovis aries]|nr:hypothetical protein MJT46_007644 [Ovis ammon polii x Ovis aries]
MRGTRGCGGPQRTDRLSPETKPFTPQDCTAIQTHTCVCPGSPYKRPEDAEHAELLCRPKRATAPPPTAQSELSEDTCSLSQATRLPKLGLEGRNEKTDLSQGAEQGSLSLLPDETGKSSWMQSKPPPTTSANTAYSFPKPELRRTKRWSFSSRYKDHWQVMESLLPSGKCPKKEARSSSHSDGENEHEVNPQGPWVEMKSAVFMTSAQNCFSGSFCWYWNKGDRQFESNSYA